MRSLKSINSMIGEKSNTIMGYDKYQVQSAVDTLKRASEIKQDPAFMKAVEVEAERQKQALAGITRSSGYHQPKGV